MAKKRQTNKKQIKRTVRRADKRKSASKDKRPPRSYGGVFQSSADGYGFITADDKDTFPADLFVPVKYVNGAVTSDRVRFTVGEYNGRTEARVTSVESRGVTTFTGIYKYIKRREGNRLTVRHIVIADDRKLCFDTLISPAHLNGANDNDKVLCEIKEYPDAQKREPARGVILKTYGSSDELYPNVAAALDNAGLKAEFPEDAEAFADGSAKRRVYKKNRLDLTEERIFTIDGAGSKDFDDAISVKRRNGGFELGVHIADVSEYVTEYSPADSEALSRGTSVYFADRVIPMLPVSLSNGACSLNPKVNRYALSAIMYIDEDGEIKDCGIYESVIRSKVRGVYGEVNDVIDKGEDSRFYKKYSPVFSDGGLDDILALYAALCRKSARRHALELESAEFRFDIDDDGNIVNAGFEERGVSERVIEQFMLAANEAVATALKNRGLPCVYRVHEEPDTEKLLKLKVFAESVGIDASALDGDISLYQIGKFLDSAKAKGKGDIISYLVLRCMMKAKYDAEPSPHFGLGSPCYCHFTSPIRRYPDLMTHRIIKNLLLKKGGDAAHYKTASINAAERSNEREEIAAKFERDMDDLYMAYYTKSFIGGEFDAVITSVVSGGFFARLPYGAEGFVRVSPVGAEYLPELMTLISHGRTYRPSDTVKVEVTDVNVSSRRIELELI